MKLPTSVRGFTRLNSDDSYTVVINSCLSTDSQRLAYIHEMNHIESCDFECDSVDDAEWR